MDGAYRLLKRELCKMERDFINRCSLIYFAKVGEIIYVLLGSALGELTTIGGRKKKSESNMKCCSREILEETKGLIDYSPFEYGLNNGIIYNYAGCSYYVIEAPYEELNEICHTFKTIISDKKECNELNDLILFDIDNLVHMFLNNAIFAKRELIAFTYEVLYRLLKPIEGRGMPVSNIQEPVVLSVPLETLPKVVDIVSKTKDGSKVYGRCSKGFLVECSW